MTNGYVCRDFVSRILEKEGGLFLLKGNNIS